MKKLFDSNHLEILSEFDSIKSVTKNDKVPQFCIIGIKNKRIHQVLCDFYNFDSSEDCLKKIEAKLELKTF